MSRREGRVAVRTFTLIDPPPEFDGAATIANGGVRTLSGRQEEHYLTRVFRRSSGEDGSLLLLGLSALTPRRLAAVNDSLLIDLIRVTGADSEPGVALTTLQHEADESVARGVNVGGLCGDGRRLEYAIAGIERLNLILADTLFDLVGWRIGLDVELLRRFRVVESLSSTGAIPR